MPTPVRPWLLFLPLVLFLAGPRRERVPVARVVLGEEGVATHIASRVVLDRAHVHELRGSLEIDAGGVLVLEAGTRVEARPGVGISVSRGARIESTGTLLEPVVLTCTSTPRYPGCWDGLRIHGEARINFGSSDSPAETGGATGGCRQSLDGTEPFGGCSDAGGSGVLRFTRIEYANTGLSLFGVGAGTSIDGVQVNRSASDGVQVIGGAVDLRQLYLTANQGYGLAWRSGWRGRGQFIVVQQEAGAAAGGVSGSNAGDANGNFTNSPRSAPTLYNVTVVVPRGAPGAEAPAVHLREGTGGTLRNVLVHSSSMVLDIDQNSTCSEYDAVPRVSFSHVVLGQTSTLGSTDADPVGCDPYVSPDVEAQWLSDPANRVRVVTGAEELATLIRNPTDLVLADFRPSSVVAAPDVAAVPPADGFFDQSARFVGALAPLAPARNNIPWYAGWTAPAPSLPAAGGVAGIVSADGVGALSGVIVQAASGQTDTTDASGAYALTLPAGTHQLAFSRLPIGCSAPDMSTMISSSVTVTQNVAVGCNLVTDIAVGALHACLMTNDRRLQCWGQNDVGLAGDGTTASPRSLPVSSAAGLPYDAMTLTVGLSHSCATRASTTYCWGLNVFGVLGFGSPGNFTATPIAVSGTGIPTFRRVFAGGYHACGLTPTGEAWCWGWNAEGQLGAGSTAFSTNTPIRVEAGALRFETLALGESHTCGVTMEQTLYCWGGNGRGESGRDTTAGDRAIGVPTLVHTALRFVAVDGGTVHTCGLTVEGRAYCWGAREFGQLGDGSTTEYSATPTAVNTAERFVQLAVGGYTSCGVSTVGRVWCWGRGDDGSLGNLTNVLRQSTPVEVMLPRAARRVDVGASVDRGSTVCAILDDGSAFCWGRGDSGQLGNGSLLSTNAPQQVRVRGP